MADNTHGIYESNIHYTAIVHPSVIIGEGTTVGAYTVIHEGTVIGKNNSIGSHVVIGGDGEIRDGKNYKGKIEIGSNNVINHHVTIDKPLNGYTVVGNNNYIMTKSHLGHDVVVFNNVTISSGSMIGGHTHIHDHATIGLNTEVHQRKIIGQGSMVGMGSSIVKNVYPFTKVVGVNNVIGYNQKKINELDLTIREVQIMGREFQKDFE